MSQRGIERRRHKRFALGCPITLADAEGTEGLKSKTVNVCDGGAFLAVPAKVVPPKDRKLTVRLLVPRTTPNTYLLEEFTSEAHVVRHDMLEDNASVGLALRFTQPLTLDLEP